MLLSYLDKRFANKLSFEGINNTDIQRHLAIYSQFYLQGFNMRCEREIEDHFKGDLSRTSHYTCFIAESYDNLPSQRMKNGLMSLVSIFA